VPSLTSQFRWLTCPDALRRLATDRERLGLPGEPIDLPPVQGDSDALVAQGEGDLFLDEYRFQARGEDLGAAVDALDPLMGRPDAREALTRQLVVVSDDMFAHLVGHATPVNAHVRLENETKTVATGALWYEETLPADTLVYAPISAGGARRSGAEAGADTILGAVTGLFGKQRPWLQLGGNETVGMGWCRVSILGER
jgi:CRISPR-associated protein Cmr4